MSAAQSKPKLAHDPLVAETVGWLRLLIAPGQVVELRALGVKRKYGRPCVTSGFYDSEHLEEMVRAALGLSGQCKAVYLTLNPLNRDLLARRCNRADVAERSELAHDKDVISRRVLLIDVDPVRPSDVSASDEEKAKAHDVIVQVREHLHGLGWPEPIVADSGNGYHMIFRVELPADDGGLVRRVLHGLAERFDTDKVTIDKSVFNPSRILKFPGTMACKGDNVEWRPHRRSRFLEHPAALQVVPRELLEALAPLPPEPEANTNGRLSAWTPPPDLDRSKIVRRAASYLAKMDPAVAGQHGHDQTYKAARVLVKDFGLDAQDAFPLLQTFNDRCQPPWSEKDLRHKLEDALKAPGEIGTLLRNNHRFTPSSNGTGTCDQRPAPEPAPASVQPPPPLENWIEAVKADAKTGWIEILKPENLRSLAAWNLDYPGTLATFVKALRDAGSRIKDVDAYQTAAKQAQKQVRDERRKDVQDAIGDVEGSALTAATAAWILAEEKFAQDSGGKLYRYVGGVYRSKAERFVKARVKATLVEWGRSNQWSSHLADEVLEFIRVDAPELWEQPPANIVNCRNGLLHLATRELKPHAPGFLSPVQIPVRYDAAATCPFWDQFIADIFPEDAQALAYEIPGVLMTPGMLIIMAIILLGPGGNGKSTYLNGIISFLGKENVAGLTLQKIESDRFAPARLVGKLANICADLPSTHLTGTSTFKAITGGDSITAECKFKDSFDFVPFCRLIFSANTPPASGDSSQGFFDRWTVVPFDRVFRNAEEEIPREVIDARLADPRELAGLLNRALDARENMEERGRYTISPSMQRAFEEFHKMTDPVAVWFEANVIEGPDIKLPKDELLSAYTAAATKSGKPGLTAKAMTMAVKRLRPQLEEAQRVVNGKTVWCWIGIGLKSNRDSEVSR